MKLFTTSTALSAARRGTEDHDPAQDRRHDRPNGSSMAASTCWRRRPALGTPVLLRRLLAGLGTNIFELKPQVKRSRVQGVTGRLYADDTIFDRLRGVADSGYATSSESARFPASPSTPATPAPPSASRLRRRPGDHRRRRPSTQACAKPGSISPTVALGTRRPRQILPWSISAALEIVNTTDVYSDNFFAEMLMKLLAPASAAPGRTGAGHRSSRPSPAVTNPACTP